jgi:RHH-type proline utilization regulon transcriptional repressor/proline dehydrogenase/delta 1-pyrroline-5-carboxylate dehydrogenase
MDLESRVRRTALRLYQLTAGKTPDLFKKNSWTGKILKQCMQNENFKVEMLRFIDVLPYIEGPKSIAKHLKQYFMRPAQRFPIHLLFGSGEISSPLTPTVKTARIVAANINRMAQHLIAGSSPREAIPVLTKLRLQGTAISADLLGEAVLSEKEAQAYMDRYLELLELLNKAQNHWKPLGDGAKDLDWGYAPKINISIKPSAMYSQMNPRAFDYSVARAKEHLRPIFRKAVTTGAHICLDMEHYELKNITLALYKSLMEEPEFRDYPHTGTVIQSYLKDSESDVKALVQWARRRKLKFNIRLAKGAYWDGEIVYARKRNWPMAVFTDKNETDANFEKLAGYLLQRHQWVHVECASQNFRSIACVMELAKDFKVPPEHLEYQMLYGMAEPVRIALQKMGFPLRLYAPIGEMIPGMAYLVRRLLENTSSESFLRQRFVENVAHKHFVRNPLENVKGKGPARASTAEVRTPGKTIPFQNEPHRDWSLKIHRERFAEALHAVRKKSPYKIPLRIGSKKITTRRKIRSINPNNPHEIVGITASAGQKEIAVAVAAAKSAFPSWRDTDPILRAEHLFQAATIARKRRYALAALEVFEVGKNWSEADADVCEAIDFLEYYGRHMIRLAAPRRMGKVPGELSHLFYEPRGVAVVIAPWNFPLAISMGMTSAALVAGNTVIFKPSSQSCITGSMVYSIFEQTKLPPGVLNFLPCPGDTIGDQLVEHPDVALICFTGSKEVGLRIIELAGKTHHAATQVKSVIAEMGGKNAIIVDADADLDEAVAHILQSAFGYQGQKCSACSRLIVLQEIYAKLLDRLRAAAESIELGSTENPEAFMGAVIDANARKKILHYINIGKKEGKCLLERNLQGVKGHFVPLTIFTDIRPYHRIAQEEIFGPLLAIMKASDFNEALEIANSTPYALTGSLFSRSPQNITAAKRKFRIGNLYINQGCTGAIVERHPFGGFKLSGIGSKAGGPDYLLQFMIPRNIVENTLRRGFAAAE